MTELQFQNTISILFNLLLLSISIYRNSCIQSIQKMRQHLSDGGDENHPVHHHHPNNFHDMNWMDLYDDLRSRTDFPSFISTGTRRTKIETRAVDLTQIPNQIDYISIVIIMGSVFVVLFLLILVTCVILRNSKRR